MTAFSARIEALDRSTMLFRRSSISLSTQPRIQRLEGLENCLLD